MQIPLHLDYEDALLLHLRLTQLFNFDPRIKGLTNTEETFLVLCMHIKMQGYLFTSEEAFMLMDLNGFKNSKQLYWNDRLLHKGWVTDKLYKNKGNADLTSLLNIKLGKPLKRIGYNFEIILKPHEKRETGSFQGIP